MSMTYLQLCQALRRECRMSGTGPSAVTGMVGDYERICNWIRQTHNNIQNRRQNWQWMRSRFSVDTTASDDTYAGTDCTDTLSSTTITRFARWWQLDDCGAPNVKIYLTSGGVGGERWLTPIPWAYFYSLYKRGTQNNGAPAHVSIDPQKNMVIGPKPDGIYTISGEYQKSALEFSANGDTPEFPARFHELVMYEAMKRYAASAAAPEVYAAGKSEANKLMRQLEQDQLPEMMLAGPMV